ncbi:MAG: hypothetical protein M1831_000752, partial [Alyxoria varia]
LDVDAPSTHVPIEAPFVQQIEKLKQRDHDLNDVQLQVLSLPSAVGLGDRKRLVNGSVTKVLAKRHTSGNNDNYTQHCFELRQRYVDTWSQIASELDEMITHFESVFEVFNAKPNKPQAGRNEIQRPQQDCQENFSQSSKHETYKDIIDRLLPHTGINVEEFGMNTGRQRSENGDGEGYVDY